MKKIFTTLAALFVAALASNAQVAFMQDSIKMTTNRVNDIYYHCGNGVVKSEGNKNWFIALGLKSQTAGVWVNHANGVACFNPHKDLSQWNTLTLADTGTAAMQYNSDTSWTRGALNQSASASNPFDFGFGKYNMAAHAVYGDSIFIIRQGTVYYKLRIDSVFGANNYAVTVGGLSAPIPSTLYTFNKTAKYSNANFMYINAGMTGLTDTAREPVDSTWDVVFTEYNSMITGIPYLVVGALQNGKVKATRVQSTSVNTAASNYMSFTYSPTINTIGYDWKVWNGSMYVYDTLNSYIVKSNDGNYYQFLFNGYRKSDGYVAFGKRMVNVAMPINEVGNAASGISITPNPSNGKQLMLLESNEARAATLVVSDMMGRAVYTTSVNVAEGLNAYELPLAHLPSGAYIATISGKQLRAAIKLSRN